MASDSSSTSSSGSSSCDEDEPPPLVLNLERLEHAVLVLYASECGDRDITVRFQKLTRGRHHEIFVAKCFAKLANANAQEFFTLVKDLSNSRREPLAECKPVWECIIRFSRQPQPVEKLSSEVATMNLVRRHHSTLGVPRIYAINFETDRGNDIGAQYMIMQKLPGRHLYKIWDNLDLGDKKRAVEHIASVLAILSGISCDVIGSLSRDPDANSPLSEVTGPFLFT
jgi:predicted Ser/Thr protein kinase